MPGLQPATVPGLTPLFPEELDDELVVEEPHGATDIEVVDVEFDDELGAAADSMTSPSEASLPCVGIVMSAGLRPAAATVIMFDVGGGTAQGLCKRVPSPVPKKLVFRSDPSMDCLK